MLGIRELWKVRFLSCWVLESSGKFYASDEKGIYKIVFKFKNLNRKKKSPFGSISSPFVLALHSELGGNINIDRAKNTVTTTITDTNDYY